MTRAEVLSTASKMVCEEREGDYGDPVALHINIGLAWTAILRQRGLMGDVVIDAEAVLLCMAALKTVREAGVHKDDNLIDGSGYLSLAAEAAANGKRWSS